MLGYKVLSYDLMCLKKQYEIGKSYHEDEAILCEKGMHFCTDPLDVLDYYLPIIIDRFCLVEADNVSDEKSLEDSKRVCKDLTIIKEFTHKEYYKEICRYHKSKNGIIEKDDCLYIFSDNNIYTIKQEYKCLHIYGNNNIIIDKRYTRWINTIVCFTNINNFRNHNNIILKDKRMIINDIYMWNSGRYFRC